MSLEEKELKGILKIIKENGGTIETVNLLKKLITDKNREQEELEKIKSILESLEDRGFIRFRGKSCGICLTTDGYGEVGGVKITITSRGLDYLNNNILKQWWVDIKRIPVIIRISMAILTALGLYLAYNQIVEIQ
jgi:methyl coenzyme M reductase alpha subunit